MRSLQPALLSFVLLLLGVAASEAGGRGGGDVDRRSLITGGSVADGKYPYVVAVARPDGAFLCAGTLVHPRVVLTAAHCCVAKVNGSPDAVVVATQDGVLGLKQQQQQQPSDPTTRVLRTTAYVHPRFVAGRFDFDIAALVLQEQLDGWPHAGLPSDDGDSSVDGDGQAVVLGWGAQEGADLLSDWLLSADVQAVDREECKRAYDKLAITITPQMSCVSGRTCAGDSGGPVILHRSDGKNVALGLVSFGFPRNKGMGYPDNSPATVIMDFGASDIRSWIATMLSQAEGKSQAVPGSPQLPRFLLLPLVRGFSDTSVTGGPSDGANATEALSLVYI